VKKPVLYVQHLPGNRNKLAFDFCYSAKMGAELVGIKVKTFEYSSEIPSDPTNIVVGSVEACSCWLFENDFPVPEPIFPAEYIDFVGRGIGTCDIKDIPKYPVFIKPLNTIKAFTGFVATNEINMRVFSEGYEGWVCYQDVIELVSEYRMYISNHKILGMKHYSGDCLQFPNRNVIEQCFNRSKQLIDYHSYTLDFGVLDTGETVLIEINDGFAIGNYGLEALKYYLFCRNRWLQLTGIRKKMDY
jgi:hypothetical protein